MRSRLVVLAPLVALAAAARPAAAQVLDFDDIADVPGGTVYVPASYRGYTFDGGMNPCGFPGQCSWVTNLGTWSTQFPMSVSPNVSAWSNGGTSLTLARAAAFDFTSLQIGARNGACGLSVAPIATFTSFLGGAQVNSTTRTLSCNAFALESFNWTNVDMISISVSPTTNAILDDISVSDAATAAPEPASIALLGGGLLGLAAVARSRRRA